MERAVRRPAAGGIARDPDPHCRAAAGGLGEQALHLAASGLLLALNLVEGELQSAAGCQPGLKQSELTAAVVGTKLRLRLSYSYGIITVRIMPHPRTSSRHPEPSAQLKRHTQRFHELKRILIS